MRFSTYSHVLNEEDINNFLTMIHPTLMSYTFDTSPVPVLLDSTSIKPDVILLLDTFFHYLIFNGEMVAAWRKAGYQEHQGYENFAELLEVPVRDVQVSGLLFLSTWSSCLVASLAVPFLPFVAVLSNVD